MAKRYSIITAAYLVHGRPVPAAMFEHRTRDGRKDEFAGTELAAALPPTHFVTADFEALPMPPRAIRTASRA